ncbi:dna gyrase subunit b : DNA gyrase subunit B OS=Singulisphaera acidiphila (strain ATCC BAA-1392 / DSM 18658 / VKM B-2454 / MOB10) GN=gyrB PE=3 SV=1: HATPase_c: DNA_gyraseB: Toprim: DNA_gyraseB_C [Gemmataceae bacterium]|nr:dna gyrase subunit b : DNA gyrase subunit B OS=Singulisphaera acidiphila (strain ATCC BAA-1392 / DSM 18658 / VKM B-2454 / MOB10) GN=gyrB PE=3 SV=1: HATPase_c: DNA_gyraseB: Toprim: DNA_gyraseB_C [Gemmataceae bacterium]VTU00593.1 dna gyrase subunit b : DNA gyrase subunit B OS=Singulisphaera acidiphila (strain ATCC BAA-1392 / DSM 18658 / VKM B-2454 / MOB10) GN=gyrB PE=3 SV=1: HATPase_c: DNA_gyraseB: Toprim: DNA_gyraseB_C [Gemmataceae bacterium]
MSDTATVQYTEENMKSLKDAAHIRQNPGMYVGNTQSGGLHHLVYEIVSNSVDEALGGYCTQIRVTLHADNSVTVSDDGRGIPVGIKKDTGKSALEEALTIAGNSGKFDNAAYRVSIGLHGMGAKAMNALSEWCEVEVRRDGTVYKMEFERGYATSPLQNLGPTPDKKTGTSITFKPDPEMFGDLKFSYETLCDRFREIAYLNRGLALSLHDERETPARSEAYKFDGGIAEYVEWLNTGQTVEHPPIYIKKEVEHATVAGALMVSTEVALQYTAGEEKIERCFTNGAFNPIGGTHLSGFRSGLTKALNAYGKKEGHFKEGLEVRGEDFREGLTVVISVGHPDPVFESQTKVRLNNPEMEGIVNSVVYGYMTEYLEKNPKEAARICKRIALSAEARIAARKAVDAIKDRKNILSGGGLPGKLFDCTTRERDRSELFLVEGDSAGGSAESGRDRMFQAVLPLRGKVLNVEKAKLDKLLKNNEISALIAATGVDIENVEDISKIRYGKIIILTDADVDGQHIRTLLLTFFFRQMRKLVEDGHLFVARPPLYKVTQKKETRFVQTFKEMDQEKMARGLKDTVLHVQAVNGRANRDFAGDALAKLLPILADVETAVVNLEKRGHTLETYLRKANADGVLPSYHVRFAGKEFWFHSRDEVDAFRVEQAKKLGKELVLGNDLVSTPEEPTAAEAGSPVAAVPAEQYMLDDWHEVHDLNAAITELKGSGFEAGDLVPLPRIAGREPPVRFVVEHGEIRRDLPHLQTLVAEIRKFGEKGISVTRFKGLGEMDPEELWETTLDPQHRTLLKVTLNDAMAAEKEFRRLMGEDVDGRRRFIFDKPLNNPEDIDYGA